MGQIYPALANISLTGTHRPKYLYTTAQTIKKNIRGRTPLIMGIDSAFPLLEAMLFHHDIAEGYRVYHPPGKHAFGIERPHMIESLQNITDRYYLIFPTEWTETERALVERLHYEEHQDFICFSLPAQPGAGG